MLTTLRSILPKLLFGSGVLTSVLSVVVALLSHDNPLVMAILLVPGAGIGFALAALGVLLEQSTESHERNRQALALAKARTRYLKDLLERDIAHGREQAS